MAKTSNYWDKRAIKRMTEAEKHSEAYINRIKKIYEQAYRDVNREINRVYRNYAKDTGLDVDKLKELLTVKETDKMWQELKKRGLDQYIKNNYKSRISRLEQIQAQIYAKAKLIYPKEELEQTMCYNGVINNSYYKAVYDTQIGTGYDFSFNKIDKNLVSSILNEKWSGKNYSQRIWKNTDILAESVSQLVGGALLSGQSIQKTVRQIDERFKVGKYYAERLVRTETNHFNNEADALAYEEMGVDEYVFVATLDTRTSPMCQSHDNKRYKYKDREVGVNYPPLHPNCRSTTRGYLGEEVERNLKRRARNPKTGKTELIDNISYEEWAKNNGLAPKMTPKSDNLKKEPKNGIINNKNKFIPAKNIIEAQEYAKKFANNVSFKGATNIDNVNIVNETLENLTTKYPTKKLDILQVNSRLKRSNARANYKELEINNTFMNKTHTPYNWAERIKANENTIQRYKDNYLNNSLYDQRSVRKYIADLEKENKYNRWSLGSDYGIKATVTHEYGHILADQYLGMINRSRANANFSYNQNNKLYQLGELVRNTFKQAKDNGDIYNISMYASTDADEFFSEVFTMQEMGEKLPKYINDMLKEVLDFGKL